MISGTAIAILVSLYPEKAGLVIGLNTAAIDLGTTFGPVLRGLMVDHAGWASLFLLTAAVATISVILALFSLDFKRRVGGRRPHFQTLLAIMVSTILVVFGLYICGLFLWVDDFIFRLNSILIYIACGV